MRPKCVIGLDRDGTINKDIWTYCHRVEDFEPIPGSISAIANLKRNGYKIVIITDQGGIEKGLYTQVEVDVVHAHLFTLLNEVGCSGIDGIYNSTSTREDDPFAKPNIGLFKQCEQEIDGVKFAEGFYVGDKMKDLKAAMNIGATPILVRTGYGLETEEALNAPEYDELKRYTLIFDTLAEFAARMA